MRSLLGRFHRPMSRGAMGDMLTMNSLGDGSTLSLDFTTMGGVLDSRLTFSRASTATFVNSSGYVDHAGANLLFNTAWTTTSLPAGWSQSFATGTFTYHGDGSITCAVTTAGRCCLNPAFPYVVTSQGLKYTFGFKVVAVSGSPSLNDVIFSNQTVETVALNGVTVAGSTVVNAGDTVSCTFTADSTSAIVRIGMGVSGNATSKSIRMTEPRANPGLTLQPYLLNPNTAAGIHAPRFDYSPTNIGEPMGLLIEGQTANPILYSQDFSQATWSKSNATATAPTTAPDGTTTAYLLTSTTAGGTISQTHAATGNATSTYSIYVKQGTAAYCDLYIYDAIAGATRLNVRFTFATKVFTVTAGSNAAYQELRNGWFRISATCTTLSTTNNIISYLYVGFAVAGTTYYGWGAQLEAGSGASSLIPTGASQVTRAVDTAIIAAGTNFSSWYTGNTSGTFVANWYGSVSSTTARSVMATSDQTTKHLHMYQTPSALTLRLADFGAAATVTTGNNLTANALTKGAFSYASTATSLCLNGGTVATGTLAFTVAPTWLSIGGPSTNGTSITDTTVMLNNSIRTLKYFPARLSDAQIKEITT